MRFLVLALGLAACGDSVPTIPVADGAPWPKFRADARQTGRSDVHATPSDAAPWAFHTGKGIFSSPVVGADGTIYVGSADRYFYALHPDGTLAWKYLTGEIIDSSALLDDRGRAYVGSGDGHVYAFDAATGDVAWMFAADAPGPRSLINWFEGNVAIGPDGTLVAPNDNFHVYGIDRAGNQVWRTDMPDQTWSSPAIDAATGQLTIGNNAMVQVLGANLWSFDDKGAFAWKRSASDGTIAASPMIARNGDIIVGGFDGYVRALDPVAHEERWAVATRDHVYASPAELPDGTIVQPSADGTIYGLDPLTGAQRWAFDTLEPIRSSPAIDADGHIYVGSGEGRLYVLDPDGTLRWSMKLIDDLRNDLNSSPALGVTAIYLGGENGDVFAIPYDYCLHDDGLTDARCGRAALPDGVALWVTTPLGAPLATPPQAIDANRPLTLSLIARHGDQTELAAIDSASLHVTVEPEAAVTATVSADRHFLVVAPVAPFTGDSVTVHVTGQYLVDPVREGLKMTGGTVGGAIDQTLHFAIAPASAGYALHAPDATDDGATLLELHRLAAPLPTILPSYNQIGFDSLHYVVGIVEPHVAWVVGGKLDAQDHTVIDPATKAVFALEVDAANGLVTLANVAGFSLEVMGATLSFEHFQITARLGADGDGGDSPALVVSTHCEDIQLYGPFLSQLGLCNPDTGDLLVSGGLQIRAFGGAAHRPAGIGEVAFAPGTGTARATITGSSIKAAAHTIGLLLVDAATGKPVSLDYGLATSVGAAGDGALASVEVKLPTALAGTFRAYLMIDAYPAATGTLTR